MLFKTTHASWDVVVIPIQSTVEVSSSHNHHKEIAPFVLARHEGVNMQSRSFTLHRSHHHDPHSFIMLLWTCPGRVCAFDADFPRKLNKLTANEPFMRINFYYANSIFDFLHIRGMQFRQGIWACRVIAGLNWGCPAVVQKLSTEWNLNFKQCWGNNTKLGKG